MKLRTAALALGLFALPALATGPAPAKTTAPAKAAPAKAAPAKAAPAKAAPARHDDHAGSDCHHPAEAKLPAPVPASDAQGWVLTRGAAVGSSPEVKLAALLANPAAHDGKTVRLEGEVRKACTAKGCWMELASESKGPGVRVTFKDYAFFVPLDSAGSKARVEGVVKVAELSESHGKHYEGEGAIVPRGKDGKYREVQLVASGVELRR